MSETQEPPYEYQKNDCRSLVLHYQPKLWTYRTKTERARASQTEMEKVADYFAVSLISSDDSEMRLCTSFSLRERDLIVAALRFHTECRSRGLIDTFCSLAHIY